MIRASWMLKLTVCSEFAVVGPYGNSLVVEHGSLGGGDGGWSTQRANLVSRQGLECTSLELCGTGSSQEKLPRYVHGFFMWFNVHD